MSTFRSDGRWSPHTTRSWEFVGLEEGLSKGWLPSGAHAGENVIVGTLDSGEKALLNSTELLWQTGEMKLNCFDKKRLFDATGIWPESRSFGDEGLGPVPARWKGVCQGGDSFNSSSCNRSAVWQAFCWYNQLLVVYSCALHRAFWYRWKIGWSVCSG